MNSEPQRADGKERDGDVRIQPGGEMQDRRIHAGSGPAAGPRAGEVVRLRPSIDRAAALKPAPNARRVPARYISIAAEGRCVMLDIADWVPAVEGRGDGLPPPTAISYSFYGDLEDH